MNTAQDTKTKRLKPPRYTVHVETVQISDFKFCIFMLRICPSQKKFKKILLYDQVFYIKDLCTIEKKTNKQTKKDVELMETFLHYEFGGLTFGQVYTWKSLILKFCHILFQHRSCTRSTRVTIF